MEFWEEEEGVQLARAYFALEVSSLGFGEENRNNTVMYTLAMKGCLPMGGA